MKLFTVEAEFLGVNCYAVAADAPALSESGKDCILIDAGFDCAPDLAAALQKQGWIPRAVFVTHGHADHVLGLPRIINTWEVETYIGAGDAYRLEDPISTTSEELKDILAPAREQWSKPDVHTVKDGNSFTIAGLHVTAHAAPGHTEGSTIWEVVDALSESDTPPTVPLGQPEKPFENTSHPVRAYFTGDVLFAGAIGRTDLPGGDMAIMQATLEKLKRFPEAAVFPGHGPSTDITRERETNPFLV